MRRQKTRVVEEVSVKVVAERSNSMISTRVLVYRMGSTVPCISKLVAETEITQAIEAGFDLYLQLYGKAYMGDQIENLREEVTRLKAKVEEFEAEAIAALKFVREREAT